MMWLREHQAMLIGEVVPLAYSYLVTNPASTELAAIDHIIVDEYQDLNALEQQLLDQLATEGNLCIAGDEDQSIYSVRYANPSGILSFLARDEVEKHSIDVCGRCPANILSMANCLIRQAPGRTKGDLQPLTTTDDGDVSIVQWPDVDAEVDGIVSAIASDIGAERRTPGQVLVLTNWRKIGEQIRLRLNEIEIPARSFFTEEEVSSEEGREALALLRLTADATDAPATRVIGAIGDAAGRTAAYRRLLGYCRANAVTPQSVLARMVAGEKLGLAIPAIVRRYGAAMARVEHLGQLDLADLVDELFPEAQQMTADLRQAALDALPEANTVDDLVRAIVAAVTQDEVPQNPDFVRIMSLHKSKGLTSDAVFVVSAINGVLPTVRGSDPTEFAAAFEEGRRLFYVAVTRAARELVISGAISMDLADANKRGVQFDRKTIRKLAGGHYTVKTQTSPFVAELGPSAPASVKGQAWLESR
jgi:superfamily I DNA/RNA helicase